MLHPFGFPEESKCTATTFGRDWYVNQMNAAVIKTRSSGEIFHGRLSFMGLMGTVEYGPDFSIVSRSLAEYQIP